VVQGQIVQSGQWYKHKKTGERALVVEAEALFTPSKQPVIRYAVHQDDDPVDRHFVVAASIFNKNFKPVEAP
jgi:hypothetical protein